jgi:hypothetical protein
MAILVQSNKKPNLTFPTLTCSIVTFNSQYAGLPLKSHKIALTATQSGSGTPSPDNVRTINGYSAINISHSDADTSNPTVYTITIGSTVYGGEYDARTGLFTVTHEIVDLGTLSWNTASWGAYRAAAPTAASDPGTSITPDSIAEKYSITSYKNLNGNKPNNFYAFAFGVIYVLSDSGTPTGNVVYELATPTTIQLPPCPIDTLEGVNNILADTGDTTLQYPKFG